MQPPSHQPKRLTVTIHSAFMNFMFMKRVCSWKFGLLEVYSHESIHENMSMMSIHSVTMFMELSVHENVCSRCLFIGACVRGNVCS